MIRNETVEKYGKRKLLKNIKEMKTSSLGLILRYNFSYFDCKRKGDKRKKKERIVVIKEGV